MNLGQQATDCIAPPPTVQTVTMSWETSFESSAGGTHSETWVIRLGGEAPPLMVDQLTRSSSDLPAWQAMPLMADGASHTSSRATRSNTGKEAEISKHVLLQGRGSNSAGRFAVIGVYNTATNTCVFWKRYYAYSVGGQGGGSAASLFSVGCEVGGAESSSVLPRARCASAAAPSIIAHCSVATVASAATMSGSAAGSAGLVGPAAGGVYTGAHAGQKRLRDEESAEPDDTLAELDVEIALLESRKEALFAKRLQVQQLKDAVAADGAAVAAAKVAADAVKVATAAVKEATAAAKEASAAAKEASVAAEEAAAAAKEAAVVADEAAAAAEVATAASNSADGHLVDEQTVLDAAQRARAATARRVEELRRGASESQSRG